MIIEIKLDKQRETAKGFSIILYINLNGKRKNIATKYSTFLKDWDENKLEPKKSHPNYSELLNYLFEIKYRINQIGNLNNYNTIEKIKSELLNNNSDDFMTFWITLVKEFEINGLKKAEKYKSVHSVVSQFQSVISFDELDYNFLVRFKNYKLNDGCTGNGVHAYLSNIRSVYNEAIRREVLKPKSYKSPFMGVMPKLSPTKDKYFNIDEIKIINSHIPEDNNLIIKGFNNTEKTKNRRYHYHNYFMLCFLLGGIDFIDLANLRYDLHVKNGRIKFERFKGGTSEIIDNFICNKAFEILELYKECTPYLINAHSKDYKTLRNNYQKRFGKWLKSIGINSFFGTKTPRYTFINIGKQLLLNREVIMELTGHNRGDVHSIYEGGFPNHIKDKVHQEIIDVFNENYEV